MSRAFICDGCGKVGPLGSFTNLPKGWLDVRVETLLTSPLNGHYCSWPCLETVVRTAADRAKAGA